MSWIIVNRAAADVSGEELLYWEQGQGWSDRASATVYREYDKNTLILPIGGEWVSLDDAPAGWPADALFLLNEIVTTPRKPFFKGRVCGWYRNAEGRLGFNVEAEAIPGLIHNYPQQGLRRFEENADG